MGAAGAGALLGPLAACSSDDTKASTTTGRASGTTAANSGAPAQRFPDGIMAGDPRPDGAVIWTRVAPPGDAPATELAW
jgi:phosphodiesterase/alkaline phosphatase D-like protein